MSFPRKTLEVSIADTLADFRTHGNIAELRARLQQVAGTATPDAIVAAAEPYRDEPGVIAPLYELIVEAQPTNARALVILANAYWLIGLGPELVSELANRAIASDPSNRGAWHLWALSEADQRQRVARWTQVSARFAGDNLALASLADNATALAGAEHDYDMLDLAVATYERLLEATEQKEQREAVETALASIRGWKF